MTNQMQEALKTFKERVFNDYSDFYFRMSKKMLETDPTYKSTVESRIQEFKDKFKMEETRYYFKFISDNGVHSFIVKEDTIIRNKQWKKGDLLKPADYRTPALNKPRGNILEQYIVQWTGPLYLKGPKGFTFNKL